ncbi:MAG: hypothetical protein LQ351_008165 [Letrouitia transgressa]|nr:MAG: hypothetical protein LQ351_008165 [Letrouitia transgressa]
MAHGSYFASREEHGIFSAFQALGLDAEVEKLTMRGLRFVTHLAFLKLFLTLHAARYHYKHVVMGHVFQRGTEGPSSASTQGPRVPTWTQVNTAMDMLMPTKGKKPKQDMEALQAAVRDWMRNPHPSMWNPMEPPGSVEATLPRTSRFVNPRYHQPDVEEVPDDFDERREDPKAARSRPRPQASARRGTSGNPFNVESDEDDDPVQERAGSPPRRRRTQNPPPETPNRDQNRAPSKRPSSSRPRLTPRGILLGTWKNSGLPPARSHAVYGSRDAKDRINRRISKVGLDGEVIMGINFFDAYKTACKHEDIDYVEKFYGMSKEEVDSIIMPLLKAADQAARTARSESPTSAAQARRQAYRQAGGGPPPVPANPYAGWNSFTPRGGRFFVDEEGRAFDTANEI